VNVSNQQGIEDRSSRIKGRKQEEEAQQSAGGLRRKTILVCLVTNDSMIPCASPSLAYVSCEYTGQAQ
jgi:hypothetical protein